MTHTPEPTTSLSSLTLERVFSNAERRLFADRLLHWYTEELNALGDRMRCHQERAETEAAEQAAAARARACEILAALLWNRDEVLTTVRGRLRLPIEMPEDAFGLGVILWSLDRESAELRTWLGGLSEDSRRALLTFDQSMKRLWD